MEVVDPEYVNLARGKTIVARELKEIATQSNLIFLEYFMASETRIIIFIISPSFFDVKEVNLPNPLIDYFKSFQKNK